MALAPSLFILYALSSSALADSPDIASPKHRLLLLKAGAIDPSQTNPLSVENSFAALSSPTKQHYIVQFSDSVSDETKQTVRDLIDNDLNWYIPYNAFVVYTTAEAILTIQQMDEITWTGIWDSKYKFQPVTSKSKRFLVFEDAPLSQAFELVITLPETPQTSELLQELRQRWTAEAAASLNCSFRIEAIPPNRLLVSSISFSNKDISRVKDFNTISAWFADKPEVYHVDRRDTFSLANYWAKSLVQNDNPEVQSESSLFFTQNGIYGQDQIIGVSDSGLSTASCFFQDPNHFVNFTFAPRNADPSTLLSPGSHRKIIQYVVPEDTGDEVDEDGHGTHVSGTVAGKVLSDPNGFSKYNGIASESRIAFFDIQKGKAVSLPFPLDTAYLPFSYGMGARVNTNSWGSTASEDLKQYTLSSHDVDRFVWNHPDMLLLFAAGNLGSSGITPPATAKNVIAVGASVSSRNMFRDVFCYSNLSDSNACSLSNYLGDDMQNDLADFSSQGPTSDDRIKPDLVAPGRYLVSAGRGCQGRTDTDLEVEQGTSMATPVVASHMLLVREYLMRGFLKNGIANRYESIAPSAALLKAIAVSGAFPIHRHEMVSKDGILSTAAVSDPPDNLQGFGRLKLNRVLNFMNNEAKHKTFIPRRADRSDPILNLTTVHLYTFCVAYKYSLYPPRFTIVWTDYPAQIAASSSLVQDIDLTVNTSSDPSLYYGNGGAAADHVNTVERVSLPGSINPGVEITVRVKASSLPMANQQPYALVATGRIVQTPCSVEFPDGVIPPDRWIDESLSVAAPLSIWAALIQLNIGDRRVQFVLGSVAVAVIAIVCCCYCAFHFDENCFHHKTKPGENLSFEFNPRLGDQASNAGGSKAISTHSEPSAGRTLYSFPSSRHQRTVSEGFASSTMKSDAIAVGPMTLKHPSLPPVRSTHQDSNLQNAWNQGTQ